jgi:hypothetical protein
MTEYNENMNILLEKRSSMKNVIGLWGFKDHYSIFGLAAWLHEGLLLSV